MCIESKSIDLVREWATSYQEYSLQDWLYNELFVARAEQIRLKDVLRQLEWSSLGPDYPLMCPLCDQVPDKGHSPDCPIGRVLEE